MKQAPIRPPVAPEHPTVLEAHGDQRVDPYYWLRDKQNPEVIAYLEAENAYADAIMAPTADLQEKLYSEIVGRVQETGPKTISRRMKSTPRKSKQNMQLLDPVNRSMRSGTPSKIATTAATTWTARTRRVARIRRDRSGW